MFVETPSSLSLYRRSLGTSFDALPPLLRAFHDQPQGGRGKGRLRVTRGTGWLRHRVADLMGLPQAGEDVPLELEVRVEGTRERWIRRFGAHPFVTTQWLDGDTLIEASGPVRFAFRLSGDPRGMTFEFRRCWCFFLPLPRFLSPRIRAATASHTDGWQIEVQIDTPMLGLLVRYEGLVTPLVADLKSDSIATSGDTLARRSSV